MHIIAGDWFKVVMLCIGMITVEIASISTSKGLYRYCPLNLQLYDYTSCDYINDQQGWCKSNVYDISMVFIRLDQYQK